MTESQLKGVDDAGFFDYVNIPPSLETMATFYVLRRIWFRYDKEIIDVNVDSVYSSFYFAPIREKVFKDLRTLDTSRTVLDNLFHFSTVLEKELIEIKNLLSITGVDLKSCLDLKWNGWGTVDKYRTKKYISDVSTEPTSTIIDAFESMMLDPTPCKHLLELLQEDGFAERAFMHSLIVNSEVICRYFFKRLSSDKKDDFILGGFKMIEEFNHTACIKSDCFCLLFFNMGNKKRLMDIISKNGILVTWLLSWPWKIFFEKYLEENYAEYFCNASQVRTLKEEDYSLFKRLSKNILIKKHINKLLSDEPQGKSFLD